MRSRLTFDPVSKDWCLQKGNWSLKTVILQAFYVFKEFSLHQVTASCMFCLTDCSRYHYFRLLTANIMSVSALNVAWCLCLFPCRLQIWSMNWACQEKSSDQPQRPETRLRSAQLATGNLYPEHWWQCSPPWKSTAAKTGPNEWMYCSQSHGLQLFKHYPISRWSSLWMQQWTYLCTCQPTSLKKERILPVHSATTSSLCYMFWITVQWHVTFKDTIFITMWFYRKSQ